MAAQVGDFVKVAGYSGVAWYVREYATDEVETLCYATDDDGVEIEVGSGEFESVEIEGWFVCTMVGDDRRFTFEVDQLTVIDEDEFCAGCGQVGCGHDGRER